MNDQRHIKLKPDWRAYFWRYVLGILLIPVIGIGLIVLWYTHKMRNSIHYEIHDRFIRELKSGNSVKIDLVSIKNVEILQSFTEKLFHIGSVKLEAPVSSIELIGMKDPDVLADTILKAKAAEESRLRKKNRRKSPSPEYHPGTLDNLDYLTGLWQQGLISDEDFKKEKKHFES
jgi:hypothetical protein